MATYSALAKYGKNMIMNIEWKKLLPKYWDWKKIIWPFRVLVHPIQAFNQIKYEKTGSVGLSIIILLLWFFSNIYDYLEYGFQFSTNKVELLSILSEFMSSAMIIVLWSIANWAICTLMDGEGWFKDIWITSCYSTMPLVVTTIPITILSKVLTIQEATWLTLLSSIAFAWAILLLLMSNTIIHQYTLKKSIFSMLLTVIGVFILLLLVVLMVSLVAQFADFVMTIGRELMFRFNS